MNIIKNNKKNIINSLLKDRQIYKIPDSRQFFQKKTLKSVPQIDKFGGVFFTNYLCYNNNTRLHHNLFDCSSLHRRSLAILANMTNNMSISLEQSYNGGNVVRNKSTKTEETQMKPLHKDDADAANKIATESEEQKPLSRIQLLKKAVAEYGTTVIVFHVTISLISLGTCYLLVSGGVDVGQVFMTMGLAENKIATSAGTFVAAYAVHKVLAPLRISITLGATPLIVRYLRSKGILKK